MARKERGKMEWSNMTAILEAAYIFTRCDSPESFAEEITKWSEKHFYDPQPDAEYLIGEVEKAVDDAKYAATDIDREHCIGMIQGLITALETMGIDYQTIQSNRYEYSFMLNGVIYSVRMDWGSPENPVTDTEEAC